ncbi:MAG: hypothetical protein M1825_001455, partial [Sarcosagium campestre]
MFRTPKSSRARRGQEQGNNSNTNSASRSLPKGLFEDGIWKCNCDPRQPADHFQTRNGGKNHGRWFYTCQKPQPKRCNFFLWDDDAKPREASAVLANSRSEPQTQAQARRGAGVPSAADIEAAAAQTPSRSSVRRNKVTTPPPPYSPMNPLASATPSHALHQNGRRRHDPSNNVEDDDDDDNDSDPFAWPMSDEEAANNQLSQAADRASALATNGLSQSDSHSSTAGRTSRTLSPSSCAAPPPPLPPPHMPPPLPQQQQQQQLPSFSSYAPETPSRKSARTGLGMTSPGKRRRSVTPPPPASTAARSRTSAANEAASAWPTPMTASNNNTDDKIFRMPEKSTAETATTPRKNLFPSANPTATTPITPFSAATAAPAPAPADASADISISNSSSSRPSTPSSYYRDIGLAAGGDSLLTLDVLSLLPSQTIIDEPLRYRVREVCNKFAIKAQGVAKG